MRRVPGVVAACIVAACAVASVGCTTDADWAKPVVPLGEPAASVSDVASDPPGRHGEAPAWEAVVRAGTAGVAPIVEGRFAGLQLLRLAEVDPMVVLFADRPTRQVGDLPAEQFLALWHVGAFGQDPPNAAVLIGGEIATIELERVVYEPSGATMAFVVSGLEWTDGTAAPGLPEGEYRDVTLFVDAISGDVNPQITDSVTQTNVKVLGEAPAMAMGSLYQAVAGTVGLPVDNAAATQDATGVQQGAATTAGLSQLYRPDTATTSVPASVSSLVDADQWSALNAG